MPARRRREAEASRTLQAHREEIAMPPSPARSVKPVPWHAGQVVSIS
jgi:hypothetical protein